MLDEEYYDNVFLELENGGVEAFYDFLMNIDLGDFHPKKRPPMTEAKQNLIALSLPSESRFLADWMRGDTRWAFVPCRSMDLYSAYLKWCKENGETRPRPSHQFLGSIANMVGWENKKARVYETLHYTGTTKSVRMVIPPPELLQPIGKDRPPEKPQSEWLTDCLYDFSNSDQDEEKWDA